jgi:hypothetical protein
MQMRHRVAVKQKHVARKAIAEGKHRKECGDHAGKDGLVSQGAGGIADHSDRFDLWVAAR